MTPSDSTVDPPVANPPARADAFPPRASRRPRVRTAAAAALLQLITVVAYAPLVHAGYIWDDEPYLTSNVAMLTPGGLYKIWFTPGVVPQYYPFTSTTMWLEYRLWGVDHPAGYHALNVLLHAASALLVWRLLRRLAVPGAWVAAAVFAVHPVHVESVAWITERKNVLSGFLYLSAMTVYLWRVCRLDAPAAAASSPGAAPAERFPLLPYLVAFALFVLSLLSKSVTSSFPAAVLLILYWKRGRIARRDVLPLVPFFAAGLAMGRVTAWMETHMVGATGPEWDLSLADRVLIAGRALWFYAWKLAWPARLSFIYTRWTIDPRAAWQWLFPASAAIVVAALWLLRRRLGRGPLVAVLFFAETLFPALGFVNVYPMRYSFVADHFQYLASLGLIALVVGAVATWVRRRPPPLRATGVVVAAAVLCAFGTLTFARAIVFGDELLLWGDAAGNNPSGWMPRLSYGKVLLARGDAAAAHEQFLAILDYNPANVEARLELADMAATAGNPAEARRRAAEAEQILGPVPPDPGARRTQAPLRLIVGNIYYHLGDWTAAEAAYRRTLACEPAFARALINLAALYTRTGRPQLAVDACDRAIAVSPNAIEAYNQLGYALQQLGRTDDAIAAWSRARAIDPGDWRLPNNIGTAYGRQHRYEQAAEQFRLALQLNPDAEEARRNLATAMRAAALQRPAGH